MKEIVGVFYESRKRLIKLGLITPAWAYLSLDKNNPKRKAYEEKMMSLGITPQVRQEDKN